MGGTRCSYRNCTMRSNGVTHMFHYPVFDKVRCHQWLTNAQRLEFLNLKVSQLKNRVVCQHHFQPDNFMNYKMDKLRFDAVPTENGPFCNSSDWPQEEIAKVMPIGPDDIENDRLTLKEKIANFSVKYGDFLINSEMDPLKLPNFETKKIVDIKPKEIVPLPLPQPGARNIFIEVPPIKASEIEKASFISNVPRRTRIQIISEKKINAPLTVKGKLEPVTPNLLLRIPPKKEQIPKENQNVVDNIENMEVLIHNPEVKSVDLNNPQVMFFPLSNEPQNVQIDQNTLCLPSNQNEIINTLPDFGIPQRISNSFPSNIEPENVDTSNIIKTPTKSINNKTRNQASPKTTLLKSKIPPERIAAIEEKRKFNKKLRDMIELCLDDNPEKPTSEIKTPEKTQDQEVSKSLEDVKIKTPKKQHKKNSELPQKHLATLEDIEKEIHSHKETNKPSVSVPHWNMLTLEARLKNMEANLLRKIDQNAERIVELKSIIHTAPGLVTKLSTSTQTKDDEETQKKLLYQEISKFLSPDANSLIYEELFLNKYSKKTKNLAVEYSPASKRKKLKRGR